MYIVLYVYVLVFIITQPISTVEHSFSFKPTNPHLHKHHRKHTDEIFSLIEQFSNKEYLFNILDPICL